LIAAGFSIAELIAAGFSIAEFNVFPGWTQIGQDLDGEAEFDNSGHYHSVSLSADGSIVAIGAYGNDGNGQISGHVRVYKNESGTWTQIGQDIDGEAADDRSGFSGLSLSADGSIVAIGAYRNDGNGTDSGHVRVYKNESGTWTQIGQDIDGEAAGDWSGYSVSLSADGSIVAIGAIFGNGTDSGHVRVYKNESGTWTQIGQDIDGEAEGDNSGWRVSLSADGSIVAIGASNGNGTFSGQVRVYKNESGTWTQIGEDLDGEAANDFSGNSVSLSADGSIVAIGANGNDANGVDSGHVRVYQNVSGTWTQIGEDIDGEAAYDNSGRSVSLSADGSIVAIGAPYNDSNGNDSGRVRVLRYTLAALKDAGVTATELKDAGYTLAELIAVRFSIAELIAAGFSIAELNAAGFTLAGFSIAELIAAGFSIAELKTVGFTATELKAAGFTLSELKSAGFTVAELNAAGYTLKQLKNAGFTADLTVGTYKIGPVVSLYSSIELEAAGITLETLIAYKKGLLDIATAYPIKTLFTPRYLKATYTIREMNVLWTLSELAQTFSLLEMNNEYSLPELHKKKVYDFEEMDVDFDFLELRRRFTLRNLNTIFSLTRLHSEISLKILNTEFTLRELNKSFSLKKLHEEFTYNQLRNEFTELELATENIYNFQPPPTPPN
jgi:ribosomal protein L13E